MSELLGMVVALQLTAPFKCKRIKRFDVMPRLIIRAIKFNLNIVIVYYSAYGQGHRTKWRQLIGAKRLKSTRWAYEITLYSRLGSTITEYNYGPLAPI
uniref:Uncharacterized protein n=1 Tax=Pararge aegeria TaxID=116150 RepID=S4NM90_9NEOP